MRKRNIVAGCVLLAANIVAIGNAVALTAPDTMQLGSRTTAVLDLLANDTFSDGREPVITFPQGYPSNHANLRIELAGMERGIVRFVVDAGSSGEYGFNYAVNGGAPTPVKVCWGTNECVESGNPPEIVVPVTLACANPGVCLSVPGTSTPLETGGRHALGHGAAGSHRDVPLRLVNGTANAMTLVVRPSASTRHLKFVTPAGVTEQLTLDIAARANVPFTLRNHFLPSTDAAPAVGTIDIIASGQTATIARFEISSVGDGAVVVPGYASCAYGDVCVYSGDTRAVSILGGSRNGPLDLCGKASPHTLQCPVKVGRPQSAQLTVVYNGIGGVDPPLDLTIGSELPLTAWHDQAVATGLVLHAGTATTFQATVNPRHEDVLSTTASALVRPLRFAVPGKPTVELPLSFRVDEPGEDCEFCRLIVAGVHYANDTLIDLGTSPSGTRQSVEVELRNEGLRSANVFLRLTGAQASRFGIDGIGSDTLTVAAGGVARFQLTATHLPGLSQARLELVEPAIGERIYSSYALAATGNGALPAHPVYGETCNSDIFKFCVFVGDDRANRFSAQYRASGEMTSPPGFARVYDFGAKLGANEWVSVPLTLVNNFASGISTAAVIPIAGPLQILADDGSLLCESNPLDPQFQYTAGCGSVVIPVPASGVSATVTRLWLRYRWLPSVGGSARTPDLAKVLIRTQGQTAQIGHLLAFIANCDVQRYGATYGCMFINGLPDHGPHLWGAGQPPEFGVARGSATHNAISHVVVPSANPQQGFPLFYPTLRLTALERYLGVPTPTFPEMRFVDAAASDVVLTAPTHFGGYPYLVERGDFRVTVPASIAVGAAAGALIATEGSTVPQPSWLPPTTAQSPNIFAYAAGQKSRFGNCAENQVCLYRSAGPRLTPSQLVPQYLTLDPTTFIGPLGSVGAIGSELTKQYSIAQYQQLLIGTATPYEAVNPWVLANNSDKTVAIGFSVDPIDAGIGVGSRQSGNFPTPIVKDVYFVRARHHVAVPIWILGQQRSAQATLRIAQLDHAGQPVPGRTSYVRLDNRPGHANADCRGICVSVDGHLRNAGDDVVLNLPPGTMHRSTLKIVNGTDLAQPLDLILLDAAGFRSTKGYVGLDGAGCERSGAAVSRCTGQLAPRAEQTFTFLASGLQYAEDFGVRVLLGTQAVEFGIQLRIVP